MPPTKIRIDCEYLSVDNAVPTILRLTDTPDTALIVQEHVPKEHIHAYIDANRTEKTIRKNLDKILTSTGNEAKSVTSNHTDWKGYQGYCLKGVPEKTSILHHGSSLPSLEELQQYYIKKSAKSPVKQIDNNTTEVINWIEKHNLPYETYKDIVVLVLKFYVKQKKPINEKYVGMISKTLYLQKNPEAVHLVADRIMSEHAPELVNATCVQEKNIMKENYEHNTKMLAYQKIKRAESQYREGTAQYLESDLIEGNTCGFAWGQKHSDIATAPTARERSEPA